MAEAAPGPASGRMSRQRTRDTDPELAVRGELHSRGLRYRVHVRPLPDLRRQADLVFRRQKVAVFVDGCFWHGCPEHRTHPKRNSDFWSDKIEANIARDRDTDAKLSAAGWVSVRVWEHESPVVAADRIERAVRSGQAPPT